MAQAASPLVQSVKDGGVVFYTDSGIRVAFRPLMLSVAGRAPPSLAEFRSAARRVTISVIEQMLDDVKKVDPSVPCHQAIRHNFNASSYNATVGAVSLQCYASSVVQTCGTEYMMHLRSCPPLEDAMKRSHDQSYVAVQRQELRQLGNVLVDRIKTCAFADGVVTLNEQCNMGAAGDEAVERLFA